LGRGLSPLGVEPTDRQPPLLDECSWHSPGLDSLSLSSTCWMTPGGPTTFS